MFHRLNTSNFIVDFPASYVSLPEGIGPLGGGGFKYFWNFHPENWGKDSQFDEHIFQLGWFNHLLVSVGYRSYC